MTAPAGVRRIVALAIGLMPVGVVAADPWQVLLTGDYHGDEVGPAGVGPWLALVESGGRAALVPARVTVQPVFDPVLDESEAGPVSGKRVRVDRSEPVLALLLGKGLSAGAVAAAEVEGARAGLQRKRLQWRGERYALGLENCSPDAGCDWVLSAAGQAQVLARFRSALGPDGTAMELPEQTGLIWAGDLDGDGGLDLIVDVSDHYNAVASVRVLLSSFAADGELVGVAARFGAVGC